MKLRPFNRFVDVLPRSPQRETHEVQCVRILGQERFSVSGIVASLKHSPDVSGANEVAIESLPASAGQHF